MPAGKYQITDLLVINDVLSFEVNFVVGELITVHLIKNGDIGFHFNPRPDTGVVVRNTRQKGSWGPEERKIEEFPFIPGKQFELMFLIDQTDIKVAVNSKHFVSYKHRIPFTSMKIFNVEGDVSIQKIEFRQEPAVYSNDVVQQIGFASGAFTPITNPPLPLRLPLPGGIRPGLMIYVSGKPHINAHRFSIDFMKRADANDIAFHFNPRFDERTVVRNTLQGGVWGDEERTGPAFPFQPGVNFDMIIRIEGNRFLIAINGQHYIEYYHRALPLQSVDLLHIDGNVTITSVRFHFA